MDLDVDDAAAVGRGQRDVPVAPRWFAMLALAVGEDDAVAAVRGAAHELEPPVGVRHVDQRPVGQPLRAGVVAALARDDLALAGRDVDDRDLRGRQVIGRLLGHDRHPAAIRGPRHPFDVDAAGRQGDRLRRARVALGATTPGDGCIDQPDLRPAAPARHEREAPAIGRPLRVTAAAGLGDHLREAGPVGLDDPDLLVPDEGEAATIRRPLRFADRLLGRGDLRGRRARPTQREREQLAGTGDLGRVGDRPLPRIDAELAGRLDGDDALDREAGGAGGGTRAAVGRHQAPGQSATAHQRPSIARCLRAWPWRQSCAQLQPSGERRSSIDRVSTAASRAARASS